MDFSGLFIIFSKNQSKMESKLRVWWIPQVPMQAFVVPVTSLEEANLVLNVLAYYDLFQLKHKVKPDYCNTGGLIQFVEETGEWFDWVDEETGEDFDEYRERCLQPHNEIIELNSL